MMFFIRDAAAAIIGTTAETAQPAPSPTASADLGGTIDQAADAWQQLVAKTFPAGWQNTIILAIIVGIVAFVVIRLIQHFLAKKMAGNMKIFYRLIYIIIIVIAVTIVLTTIEPLKTLGTTLLASSGIVAVVVGLAAQNTLGNLFSGISISGSKPFLVGEIIEILNTDPPIMGVVKDIGLRHTTITDATNKDIVVPNSVLDKELIRTSHSLDKEESIINYLTVGIAYDSDIDLAISTLRSLAEDHESSLDVRSEKDRQSGVPKVAIHVTALGESSVTLRASIWTKNAAAGFAALSDLRYAVLKEFKKQGIDIPYPYRNVILMREEGKS